METTTIQQRCIHWDRNERTVLHAHLADITRPGTTYLVAFEQCCSLGLLLDVKFRAARAQNLLDRLLAVEHKGLARKFFFFTTKKKKLCPSVFQPSTSPCCFFVDAMLVDSSAEQVKPGIRPLSR